MDWLETLYKKGKGVFKNWPLRKSLAAYIFCAIILTVLAVLITFLVCDSWQNVIWQVNGIEKNYRYIGDGDFAFILKNGSVELISAKSKIKSLNQEDERLWSLLSAVRVMCVPVYSVLAVILVSVLFYREKLREPIGLLRAGMQSVGRNDFNFSCRYECSDELGDICCAMDNMRLMVLKNQEDMKILMEEQKQVNAAFAHDLRTPLTVISGYVEMLSVYYRQERIDEDKLMEILAVIQKQVKRLQMFSQTMKEVQDFEMLEPKREKHTGLELEKEIKRIAGGMKQNGGPDIDVLVHIGDTPLLYDENIVMEVLGNLLSNALRYGKEKIDVLAELDRDVLCLYVRDDGRGMTKEELYKADSPYYSDKQFSHFGLGLTICKILCKKHGGKLVLANSLEGGAIVCGQFFVG